MSDESPRPAEPARRRGGCLLRIVLALAVLVALFVGIGLLFDQGDNAQQPQRGYDAGEAEAYQRADVNYLETERIFVTRLADGTFIALYDKSPKQQEQRSDCRVSYDENAQLGPLEQLDGMRGAFVEVCEGARAVWRVDGVRSTGAGYGDLDRFRTSVTREGRLLIDTRERTCTRSRGVAGVPPFDQRICEGNPR